MTRVLFCVAAVALLVGQASADFNRYLTTTGAHTWANGAYFLQLDPKGTGTGNLDPFVRIANNELIVEGYNTDGRTNDGQGALKAPLDGMSPINYTHAVLVSSIPIVEGAGGTTYWQVLLDINQQGGASMLTLNELQIYRGAEAQLRYAITENLSSPEQILTDLASDLVWDLDAGPEGDGQLTLDASIGAPGQGQADMVANIPTGGTGDYFLLFSQFGGGFDPHYANNDGYEEWGVGETTVPVPVPGAVILGMLGMSVAGWRLRRFA